MTKKSILPKKDTSIEVKIQKFLTELHVEFYTHKYMNIENAYQCDIFIPEQKYITQKIIIEADGCYWHGCERCMKMLTEKQINGRERDKKRTEQLQQQGFRVIRLWEHVINGMGLNDFEKRINFKVIKLQ